MKTREIIENKEHYLLRKKEIYKIIPFFIIILLFLTPVVVAYGVFGDTSKFNFKNKELFLNPLYLIGISIPIILLIVIIINKIREYKSIQKYSIIGNTFELPYTMNKNKLNILLIERIKVYNNYIDLFLEKNKIRIFKVDFLEIDYDEIKEILTIKNSNKK
jgi:magnesium-transporting ATPase (P-type)